MAKTLTCGAEPSGCQSPLKINIIGVNQVAKQAIIFNPRCKKWDCPFCAGLNTEGWLHRGLRGAMEIAAEGRELRFVTLTSKPYATPNMSIYFFKLNWPKLVRRAAYHTKKVNGQSWAFLLIPEQHKTGRLHCHMIASTHLKSKWWKDNANSTGFGYMAKSDEIDHPAKVAGYVVKYLAKSVEFQYWPKGFRRVRTSRNWPKELPEIRPDWDFESHNDDEAMIEKYNLTKAGYKITDKREK